MTIPYIKRLQKDDLVYVCSNGGSALGHGIPDHRYKYQYWRDTLDGRQKMIRDDKETQYIFLKDVRMLNRMHVDTPLVAVQDIKYDIVPANAHLKCFKTSIGGGSGPTLASSTPAAPSAATTRRLLHFSPEEIAKLGFVRTGSFANFYRTCIDTLFFYLTHTLDIYLSYFTHTHLTFSFHLTFYFSHTHTHLDHPQLLPDLSEPRWERNGTEVSGATHLHRYTYLLRKDMGKGRA